MKHRHHYDIEDFREHSFSDTSWDGSEFTRDELFGIISELPAGYRMVFNLYAVEGFKHKEIAKKLEIDINTSKSQYSRAKRFIQVKLEHLKREKISISEDATVDKNFNLKQETEKDENIQPMQDKDKLIN
jgi:DNA-directed RNA polymerase specialized sigma24 family protein